MELIPSSVQEFAEKYTTPESAELYRLHRETYLKVEQPHMLSGHLQGTYLTMLSQIIAPKRILEIGTYTGYSAICLAKGLTEDGHLHTIDINEELEMLCSKYFTEAGLSDKITMHIGKAMDIIPTLEEEFDLVFIDADKAGYEAYYDLIWNKLRVGGVILADNVLFHGDVLKDPAAQGSQAKAMIRFCEKVLADKRATQVLLTLRDGLLMIRKNEQ